MNQIRTTSGQVTGEFVVSRYADVDEILRDWHRFSYEREPDGIQTHETDTSILQRDPPAHTQLRALVSRAFTPRRIATIEEHIRETAHALLDEVADHNESDLMSNLAALLPIVVIAKIMDVPTEDREQFKAWSDAFIKIGRGASTTEEAEQELAAASSLYRYFGHQVEIRREQPADDLLTRLISAKEEGDQLSEHEMISTLTLLLLAGNETTTNLIGNGLKALLEHPDQLHALRDRPELLDIAIEELLRYDSPVQLDPRRETEAVVLGGKTVEPCQQVPWSLAGQIAIRRGSAIPRRWISRGQTPATSHSGEGFTSASEPRLHGLREGLPLSVCWSALMRSGSAQERLRTDRTSPCEVSSISTSSPIVDAVSESPQSRRTHPRPRPSRP